MRNKRIIALFVALMLTFSTLAISASAKTALNDEELMDVKTFRLLEDEAKLDETISRAMFAKLTVRLVDKEQFAYAMGEADYFSDVVQSHWANIYINLLRSLEIVSGDGTTCFYPERGITYNEALKILVGAMGYTIYAQKEGGYPQGYAAVAARLGMTKGVDAGEYLTYADAMQMFYNCLDIEFMEQTAGKEEYYISDITPRDTLLGNEDVGMVKLKGIVQANYNSYLEAPVSEIKEDEILFYDMLMKTGTSGVENYLGQEVEVYVSTNNDGRYTVETVLPTDDNEITAVAFDDISDFSRTKIYYTVERKNYDLDIESGVKILYNGRLTDYDTAIKYMDNGSVTLISNDGDEDIDVIFVDNYVSAVVETINYDAEYIVLGGNKTVNGQKGLRYDGTDEDVRFYFRNSLGEEISPSEIEEGDIVSVFADLSNRLIFVRKGLGSVTGAIAGVSRDDKTVVTINGTDYIVENGLTDEMRSGITVEAFLNFENKIARIDEADDAILYAAIIKTGKEGLGNAQVKMLLPGPIADETEMAEDPDDDLIVSLAAQNSAITIMTLADNVKYLGERLSEEEVKSRIDTMLSGADYYIVEYRLNSNGEISHIDVPEQIGTAYSKIYNSDERTFGGTAGGAFGVCDETHAICVPANDTDDEMDYMTRIKMSNGRSYYVASYVYNEDTYCADLIVIEEVMVYQTTGNISGSSEIGLVEKVSNKKDESGEYTITVTLLTEDGKVEKVVSEDTTSSFNFESLKSGDLIAYSTDTMDRLDGAQNLVSSRPVPPSRVDSKAFNVYSGYIMDADYNVVSEPLNRWVDAIYFTTEDGRESRFEVRKNGTPPIYIYDTQTQTAQAGTSLDFMRSHQRVVVCTSSSTTVKAILIIL